MTQENYITKKKWFAWYPIKTVDEGWKWLTKVNKTIDERPFQYMGLLPVSHYSSLNYVPKVGLEVFLKKSLTRTLGLKYGTIYIVKDIIKEEVPFKIVIGCVGLGKDWRQFVSEDELIYIPS